jgi:hypothetical protein
MEPERRRVVRFQFIAPAELIEGASGARSTTYVTDLSLHGCCVGVTTPPREGTDVGLKIGTTKNSFEARAKVVHSHPHYIGVAFCEVTPHFATVLRNWLAGAKFPKGRL